MPGSVPAAYPARTPSQKLPAPGREGVGSAGGYPGATILYSRADDVVPFEDSLSLISKTGRPESALIEVGRDHRLADHEPLEALLKAVEARG